MIPSRFVSPFRYVVTATSSRTQGALPRTQVEQHTAWAALPLATHRRPAHRIGDVHPHCQQESTAPSPPPRGTDRQTSTPREDFLRDHLLTS